MDMKVFVVDETDWFTIQLRKMSEMLLARGAIPTRLLEVCTYLHRILHRIFEIRTRQPYDIIITHKTVQVP